METYMDYSTPTTIFESGVRAFNLGVSKDDCPISRRTHANAIHWWNDGWDSAAAKTCKGTNCNAVNGAGHSNECIQEHEQCCSEKVAEIPVFEGTREALQNLGK